MDPSDQTREARRAAAALLRTCCPPKQALAATLEKVARAMEDDQLPTSTDLGTTLLVVLAELSRSRQKLREPRKTDLPHEPAPQRTRSHPKALQKEPQPTPRSAFGERMRADQDEETAKDDRTPRSDRGGRRR